MKPSPAMVVNVCAQTGIGAFTVQRVLNIALADVPESAAMTDAEEHYRARINRAETRVSELTAMLDPALADLRRAEARIVELEAKLVERPATDEELIAEMERRAAELSPYNSTRLAYSQCAQMLRERKVKP